MRVLIVLVLLGGAAQSAEPPPVEAKRHLDDGNKHFYLGAFFKAAEEYKLAYRAMPDASFLYNTAQALRLANEFGDAIFFYRSFLAAAPRTPMRYEVEQRIAQLEGELRSQRQAALDPPIGTVTPDEPKIAPPPLPAPAAPELTDDDPPPAPAPPKPRRWWPWAVAGAAVVVGVALGVGLGVGLNDSRPKADASFHF